ncbi:MAG TPA: hypothetical protein PLK13_20345 [Xanthobacteraceae bacterium]|jgi:hypothetical protein|nr:hypothetical protein [Xanthobacteraceae bacterium]HQS49508.1 hypothetical protein [Xanthobacteraceae bacterium]
MTAYPHLDPAIRAYADLPARERIEHIRVDRWIDYWLRSSGIAA